MIPLSFSSTSRISLPFTTLAEGLGASDNPALPFLSKIGVAVSLPVLLSMLYVPDSIPFSGSLFERLALT